MKAFLRDAKELEGCAILETETESSIQFQYLH